MSDKMTIDDFFKDTGRKEKQKKKTVEVPEEKKHKKSGFKMCMRALLERLHILRNPEHIYDDRPASRNKIIAFRVIFWALAAILLIKGIVSAVFPVRPIVQKYVIEQQASESDTAKAFALQFSREYLTYDEKDQEGYKKRLSKYTASNVPAGDRMGKSKVLEANIFNIKKIDGKNSVITVYLKVSQLQNEKAKEKQKDLYLKVPIYASDSHHYVVQDAPIFDTQFEKAEPAYEEILNQVPDQTRTEIRQTLENFFKIYDRGTVEQISYFFKPAQKLKGYEGIFQFQEISGLDIYPSKEDVNKVSAAVTIILKDDAGSEFRQKLNLLMFKEVKGKESRWYIEKILDSINELNKK